MKDDFSLQCRLVLSQKADERGPRCFFSLYRLHRVSGEVINYGRAARVYMKRGEGEVKPAKLASDSRLSQLALDYVTCEYFIVTS